MRILITRAGPSAIGAALAAAMCLAGCSSSAGQPGTSTIAAATTSSSTTSAATTAPASAAATTSPSASPSPTGAQNLVLTDSIRAQLVAAAAKLHDLPASDYVGLVHGESYYGFDPATNTYWAGGALDPSQSSQAAQVSVQDDGGYYIFEEPSGGSWTAYAEGLGGIDGGKCSVTVPPALVAQWHWAPGACHPAGI